MTNNLPLKADSSDMRETISLDGVWSFCFEEESETLIDVPAPWESTFPELINRAGTAVYKRKFVLDKNIGGKIVSLCFGAVDYYAEVWLNDHLVGTHEGGYTPFQFEIQNILSDSAHSEHTLVVKVTDSTMKENAKLPNGEELIFAEIPHGKQSWYSSVGGIWQSVSLEIKSRLNIAHVEITTDIIRSTADFKVKVSEFYSSPTSDDSSLALLVNVFFGDVVVASAELNISNRQSLNSEIFTLNVPIPDASLWSPESPSLYRAEVQLQQESQAIDVQNLRFGMRHVETRDGRVCLNGKPVFLRGVLDQDFYPRTIYTPPSSEYLRDQFIKAKELGLNLMRCHIKIPDPEYLNLCDELGLMVWYEIPNGDTLTEKFRERSNDTFNAMWHRDSHHPCIIAASIINEGWGIDLQDPAQRTWLKEAYHRAKNMAPSWLIVDNSPCHPNFHIVSDLDDYHVYFNIPDQAGKFAEWMHNFTSKRYHTYSTYGDADYEGNEPLILSEFGNWGLPHYDKILEAEGGEPYWFDTGDVPTRPRGVLERFESLHLERSFKDYNSLADASQEQEWLALKWEIEEMRLHPQIAGYVITEFTDLNWECNGLLDMGRNPKVFHDRSKYLQAQDILIPRLKDRNSFWGGESAILRLTYSSFSGRKFQSAKIVWSIDCIPKLEGVLSLELEDLGISGQYGNFELPSIQIDLLEGTEPLKYEIKIALVDEDDTLIAATTQNIVIVPNKYRYVQLPLPISEITSDSSSPIPLLATEWNSAAEEYVKSGGRLLLIVNSIEAVPDDSLLGIKLHDRSENGWWGDWCATKTWFSNEDFPSLPDRERFDFEYEAVVPHLVFTGASPDDVISGLYAGWLHNPAGIAAKINIGKGRVVITTFDLLSNFDLDPIANLLLADLIRLL